MSHMNAEKFQPSDGHPMVSQYLLGLFLTNLGSHACERH